MDKIVKKIRVVKARRASPKPKAVYEPTIRTHAIKHLASHLNSRNSNYINRRYVEGFRAGLLQTVVSEEDSQAEIQKIIISEKILFKKREWEKDPLQNGMLNGRRFALTYLLNVDYKMIFGEWSMPTDTRETIPSSNSAAD